MKKAKLFSMGIFALCQFLYISVSAQQGKDGAANINTAGIIANPTVTRLTANAFATNMSVKVNSTAGFAAGDLIFIIQMYGADVNAITDPNNFNNSLPNDTSYGKIKTWGNVGHNEFAQVNAVPDGITLDLDCQLQYDYTHTKKVQVLRVPRYTSLTITAPGTITCLPWNGVSGGVIVLEVQGNTIINAGASIDASAMGFRGGVRKTDVGYGASNTGSWWPDNGAVKGESIVGDTTYYHNTFSGSLCKANVANGGGGGNSMNCGGGGGSNAGILANWNGQGNPDNSTVNNTTSWSKEPAWPGVNGSFRPTSSSGGGRGGYAFSSSSSAGSANPTITGPNNNAVWGSDDRHNDGGWGGIPLDYSGGKMYMGGGGGAGDDNDGNGTAGANGGGIIYLMNYGTVGGAGQIISNGGTAINTNWNPAFGKCGDDGAGGGGGGGAVFVNSVGAINLTNATPISAVGGNGGSYQYHCVSTTKDFGPGGGGGGGYVGTSNAVVSTVAGGANGICILGGGNNSQIAQKFPPNGATAGGAGTTATITNFFLTTTNYTICAGSSASLSVTVGGTAPSGMSVNWYTVSVGGSAVGTGNPYNTGPLALGTYTYYVGTCPGTFRSPVIVNVLAAPTVSVVATPTAVCAGQTATLTASGAATFTWSANAGGVTTATTVVSPTVATTYTVTGANGTCSNTQTVSVAITSAPTLTATATPTAVCVGQQVILTASGAGTFTWSANAGSVTTATAAVTPTITTTYTVTGGSGGCTGTQTVSVVINNPPTLTVTATPTAVCAGQTATLTANGATTYTWSANAGAVTTATAVVTPTVATTYTVTGDNAGCTSTQTVAVGITAPPTLTITATPAAICNGQSSLLTGSGATSYTWSANAGSVNTTTVSVSPTSTTSYTLTGDNGGCTSTQIISVVVNNGPTSLDSAFIAAACGQANGSYTINVINGGSPNYQVNFNNTGFTPIASFPYVVGSLSQGLYPVVIQDNNGCTYTTSVNINNSGGITQVDSTTGMASCNPNNNGYIVLNAVTGGTGPYQVDMNGGGFTTIVSFPDTVKNLTAGVYTVTVKDNSGCLHTSLITVNSIGAITQVNSTTQNAICVPPNSGGIVITSVTGGTGPYQSNINGAGFNSIASFPDSVKNLTAGSYTVVIQDANGCANTSVINVGSQGGPTALSSTTANDTCNKSVGTLTVGAVSGGSSPYQYSINGGTLQASNNFGGLAPGIYTVTVQDNNGCTITIQDTVNLTNVPSPTVTAQGPTTFCQGGSVVLSSSSTSGNTWNTTATTQTISVNSAGVYSVSVTLNGCTVGSNTVAVSVNPTPTITVNSTAICQGSSGTIIASGASTYTWLPTSGISSPNSATVTANPASTTVYTISGTDANGCVSSDMALVTVNPTPGVPFVNPDTLYYCLYQAAGPLNATSTGGATLNWYYPINVPLASAPTPSTNILGTTTYYVSQSLGVCASALFPITVMVVPGPSAAFVTNPTTGNILPAQSVTFTPNQQYPFYIYAWDFDDAFSGSNNTSALPTPNHTYVNAGTYCPQLIIVSTQTGCIDSFRVCLDVLNGITITIPNVFTPNDDHINDVFSIKTEGIRDLTCDIFDRWGLKLYSFTSVTGYWDGTTSGKQCSDGTYFYVITATDVKGAVTNYKGYVQLLK